MCGMYPPERYVFSMGFTIGSGLLAMLLVINHVRTQRFNPERAEWSAGVHLGIGLSSTLCLALMATVPVSEYPVPHVMFAVFFFLLVLIFQAINSVGRVRQLMRKYSALGSGDSLTLAAKEAWMIVWMVICFVGFFLWQTTGSTVAQYAAVASVMLHFCPYIWEFRDTDVALKVELSSDDAERAEITASLLENNSAGRSARSTHTHTSAITPLAVVFTVCGVLWFILAHLSLNTEGRQVQESMKRSYTGKLAQGPLSSFQARPPQQDHDLGIYRYRGK